MDWTEKLERRKNIRKMAYRMLWADFRDMLFSWKVFLIGLTYLGFFLLPYLKMEDFNFACLYYFVTWVVIALNAVSETSFNYLPLSTKDIVYYMKVRTNHQIGCFVLLSGLSAIALDALGVEVFWERGLTILVFLLITVEWMFFMTLYSYSKPREVNFLDASIPMGRKIRIVFYNIYGFSSLIACMIVGMFMDMNENAKIKLLVMTCIYLVMLIFRADASCWVRFMEYNKTPRKSMWGNAELSNQK